MYGVKFVKDDELPEDREWVMVFRDDGEAHLFVKESAVCERVLDEAWQGFVDYTSGSGNMIALDRPLPTQRSRRRFWSPRPASAVGCAVIAANLSPIGKLIGAG